MLGLRRHLGSEQVPPGHVLEMVPHVEKHTNEILSVVSTLPWGLRNCQGTLAAPHGEMGAPRMRSLHVGHSVEAVVRRSGASLGHGVCILVHPSRCLEPRGMQHPALKSLDRLHFFFLPDNCIVSSDPFQWVSPTSCLCSFAVWRQEGSVLLWIPLPWKTDSQCDQRGLWILTSCPDGPAVTGSMSPLPSALVLKTGLVNTLHSGTT